MNFVRNLWKQKTFVDNFCHSTTLPSESLWNFVLKENIAIINASNF